MVAITVASLADLEAIVDLENSVFSRDRFSRRQFRYLLTRPGEAVFKMTSGDMLVGYIILLVRKGSKKLRIYSLGINPKKRRFGYGARLLSFAEKIAIARQREILTLEVCEYNHSALRLYLAHGYVECGRKQNYYEDGCAALLMTKTVQRRGENDPSPYKS